MVDLCIIQNKFTFFKSLFFDWLFMTSLWIHLASILSNPLNNLILDHPVSNELAFTQIKRNLKFYKKNLFLKDFKLMRN